MTAVDPVPLEARLRDIQSITDAALSRLDRKMRHFEPDALATVLYAVIDTAHEQMRVCLAGHLAPVIARPGLPAEPVRAAAGLMVGVGDTTRRPVTTVTIPPGALLCF